MDTNTTPQLDLDGLDTLPEADQLAVFTTLGALLNGFQQRNADALDAVYSDDADWVNAFGSVKHGRAEIVDYLRGLFADDNFNDGQLVAPPQSTIRRITDDVVTVSTHLQIRGQGLVGGGADRAARQPLAAHRRPPAGRHLARRQRDVHGRPHRRHVRRPLVIATAPPRPSSGPLSGSGQRAVTWRGPAATAARRRRCSRRSC